jgi:TPR repeat protein
MKRGSGPFRARRGGRIAVGLAAPERALLVRLLTDLAQLLAPPDAGPPSQLAVPEATGPGEDWARWEASMHVSAPADPALARLLPDGHRGDADLAQSYRRLTESSLRDHKGDAARTAAAALNRPEPVVLTASEAGCLLTSLTDARLVLAERLGVRSEADSAALHQALRDFERGAEQLPEGDPEALAWVHLVAVFETLAWWQEELLTALS